MFVQIVGDAPQVPSLSSGGGGSDPSFALLAGGDSYPDIYVGRFSAQTVAEMETQVLRSVHYERDIAVGADWIQKAFGISLQRRRWQPGRYGRKRSSTHGKHPHRSAYLWLYPSRPDLSGQGATAAMVTTSVNAGRGFANYVGHGSATTWVTTGFSNNNVNALTNDYMLPFIVSVACVNGNFVSQTCFAEAWLRSVNETTGAPAGAVAFYGSTINQGWNPPMRGQDEVTDLLVGNLKHRIGSLYYNGSSKMIEVYGTSGISEYKCWTILAMPPYGENKESHSDHSRVQSCFVHWNEQLYVTNRAWSQSDSQRRRNGVRHCRCRRSRKRSNQSFPCSSGANQSYSYYRRFDKQTLIQTLQVLPSDGPYIVVVSTDFSDNNDNLFSYGETIQMSMNLENIGSEIASGVSISLSTQDSHVTILNPSLTIAHIASGATGNSGFFNIQLSNSFPDQHVVPLTVSITTTDGDAFTYERSFTGNAPAIGWGNLQVDDSQGNNNGRVDAGENVTVTFNVSNTGHCEATAITSTLVVNGVPHLITPIISEISNLPVGASGQIIYSITFSSQYPWELRCSLQL
jgi:hypothetical protein